jgi:hypothetical protein
VTRPWALPLAIGADERRRIEEAGLLFAVAAVERLRVMAAQLEMQVGEVLAVGRANGAQLLAAEDELTGADLDGVEVGVERFDLLFGAVAARVSDADEVAQSGPSSAAEVTTPREMA